MATRVTKYRQDPGVQSCKAALEKQAGGIMAIQIVVTRDGRLIGHSYGVTGALCTEAGKLLDAAVHGIEAMA